MVSCSGGLEHFFTLEVLIMPRRTPQQVMAANIDHALDELDLERAESYAPVRTNEEGDVDYDDAPGRIDFQDPREEEAIDDARMILRELIN